MFEKYVSGSHEVFACEYQPGKNIPNVMDVTGPTTFCTLIGADRRPVECKPGEGYYTPPNFGGHDESSKNLSMPVKPGDFVGYYIEWAEQNKGEKVWWFWTKETMTAYTKAK